MYRMTETILLVVWLFIITLACAGCAFYRHDSIYNMETKELYDSKTYWSFAKDIAIDSNDISVLSESKNGKIYTPYGIGEIGD